MNTRCCAVDSQESRRGVQQCSTRERGPVGLRVCTLSGDTRGSSFSTATATQRVASLSESDLSINYTSSSATASSERDAGEPRVRWPPHLHGWKQRLCFLLLEAQGLNVAWPGSFSHLIRVDPLSGRPHSQLRAAIPSCGLGCQGTQENFRNLQPGLVRPT